MSPNFDRGPDCPSAVALERISAGEPPPGAVAPHVASCERCRGYLEALKAQSEAFLRQRPEELFARQVARRAEASPVRSGWRTRWHMPVVGLAATALVAIVLAPRLVEDPEPPIRFKGSLVRIYAKSGEAEPKPLAYHAAVSPGDTLRFELAQPLEGYLAVLERDAAGQVSVFFPFEGAEPAEVSAQITLLPGAVTLDATLGEAWLVAIYSPSRFDLGQISAKLASQESTDGGWELCTGCTVEAIRVKKGP